MRRRKLSSWISHNGTLKLFSLAFACGLWLLVNAGERDTEQTMLLPVELRNLPAQFVVVGQRVDFVDVRVSGPRTLLGRLSSKKILLDLTAVRPGPSSFRITTELLNLPRGVKLLRVTPSVITLDIARMTKRVVPVRVDMIGKPPFGYTAGEVDVSPATVEVSGPAPQVEKLQAIATETVDLSRLTQPVTRELQLLGPEGDLISYNVERVRARIDVQEVLTTREFRRIRITVKNTEYRVVPAPPLADVVVRGPQRVVDKMSLANGEVFVDASGQGPGTVTLPVSVLLPPEVEIVAQDPNEVELNLLSESEKKSPSAPPPEKKKKSGV
jgi:YbbR domain-containing protein